MNSRVTLPTVSQIRLVSTRGPWDTKSGGVLTVLFALSVDEVHEFLTYDEEELKRIPNDFDIRGLRSYSVKGLPNEREGGGEFHRIHKEFIFLLTVSTEWEFEDLYGEKLHATLTPKQGVYLPPFTLHSYKACEAGSSFMVLANTLFDPDRKETHDTYSCDEFQNLQRQFSHA